MKDVYLDIKSLFKHERELCGVSYNSVYNNSKDFSMYFSDLFDEHANNTLIKRSNSETYFYDFLENQLFHNIVEMKFYSDVNVLNSRRLTAISKDCISQIHLLIRDEIIFNVYFRSSDFDNALLCDLKFLSTIPQKFIQHLMKHSNDENYSEINSSIIKELKNKKIIFNTFFGSLHRTNNE